MTGRAAHVPTLFEHADIVAAREAVRAAEEVRDDAERRVRRAPHGTFKARFKTFSQATHELLLAEAHLKRLVRESGQ